MNSRELTRKLIDEYHALERLVAAVRAALDADPPIPAALSRPFEHLRAHLNKHFALEETQGYMKPVLELRPELSAEVATLREEHADLRARADAIMTALRRPAPDPAALAADVRELLDRLAQHEKRENNLIQSVHNVDIGTKD